MYLFALVVGMCVAYIFLTYLFVAFFEDRRASARNISARSLIFIIICIIVAYTISDTIPDIWWGNRFLHAVGGGALCVIICFLVVRDNDVKIGRFQFLVFSAMVVTTLGVGNEILEYYAQTYFDIIAASTIDDTWLDLISNTVGIGITAALLTPLIGRTNHSM